jgi:prolyl-tRNA synthetase
MGEKTPGERFPGAVATYCIEAMMQDRKALQGGTSHFLGQKFAKAAGIKFNDVEGTESFAWTTSWGVTTRLIGAMIMIHSDDDGLVLPPRIASAQIVLIPIIHKEETKQEVLGYCHGLAGELRHIMYEGKALQVIVDEREMRGGDKTWNWIKRGVPIRIEIGPRDIASDSLGIARRDRPHRDFKKQTREELLRTVLDQLEEMQQGLYEKALAFQSSHIHKIDTKEAFYAFFTPKNRDNPEIHGGFAFSHWSGDPEVEEIVKKDLNVTIRCIPFDSPLEEGHCVITGKKSKQRVLFAKAY